MLKIYKQERTETVLEKTEDEFGHVVIEKGVSIIGEGAFKFSRVESVNFPTSLKKIGKSAFLCCHNLRNVEIPEGVQEIDEYAFSGCSNLEYVSIPSTVFNIKENVFQNCTRLKKIVVPLHLVYQVAEAAPTAIIEIRR